MGRRPATTAVATVLCTALSPTPAAMAETSVGCYVYGQKFRPSMHGMPLRNVGSAEECQARCKANKACMVFGYYDDLATCYLGPSYAIRVEDQGAVSGPEECPLLPSWCTQVPDPDEFPGRTPEDSNAVWKTGLTPPNLQCWPHNENRKLVLCTEDPVTVLADHASGWTGVCQGLHQVTLPPSISCARHCREDVWCSEWSTTQENGVETCWEGLGDECHAPQSYNITGAQRLMHGHYRVLRDLAGVQVLGLVQMNVLNEGGIKATPEAVGIRRCNHTCLSLINCQMWLYSDINGCWIENPAKNEIEYPPSMRTWKFQGEFAISVVAGQFIQRICGHMPATAPTGNSPATDVVPQVAPAPSFARCSTFTCPHGFSNREGDAAINCAGPVCTPADQGTCCVESAKCLTFVCPQWYELKLEAADTYCQADRCSMLDMGTCCKAQPDKLEAPPEPEPAPTPVPVYPVLPASVTPAENAGGAGVTGYMGAPGNLEIEPIATTGEPSSGVEPLGGAEAAPPTPTGAPDDDAGDAPPIWAWLLLVSLLLCISGLLIVACLCMATNRGKSEEVFLDDRRSFTPLQQNQDSYAEMHFPPQGPQMLSHPSFQPQEPRHGGLQPVVHHSMVSTGPQSMMVDQVSYGQNGGVVHTLTELVEVPEGTPGAVPFDSSTGTPAYP